MLMEKGTTMKSKDNFSGFKLIFVWLMVWLSGIVLLRGAIAIVYDIWRLIQ